MDEDKKRKKNKKKKNKQNKTTTTEIADNGEAGSSVVEQLINVSVPEKNGNEEVISGGVQEVDKSPVKSDYIVHMEKEILLLQGKKETWLQKEINLVDKIKLLENDKETIIFKENSVKEVVNKLSEDKIGLEKQVKELEGSRRYLLQENQELSETIHALKSRLQHLEKEKTLASAVIETERMKHSSEYDDLMTQMQAEHAEVEKLNRANSELVEKVNELSRELDQQNAKVAYSSSVAVDQVVDLSELETMANHPSDLSDRILISDDRTTFPPSTSGDNKDLSIVHTTINQIQAEESPLESFGTGEIKEEIARVPLDDNELHDVIVSEAAEESNDRNDLFLTDAPLIGAPFRLISFFAKYVSGADLVKN